MDRLGELLDEPSSELPKAVLKDHLSLLRCRVVGDGGATVKSNAVHVNRLVDYSFVFDGYNELAAELVCMHAFFFLRKAHFRYDEVCSALARSLVKEERLFVR